MFEADFAADPTWCGATSARRHHERKIRYLVDPRVVTGTAWLTGANEAGRHAVNVVAGRDFTPDGTIEAAEVRPGDPCPNCWTAQLTMRRGIEIGHIFQLGRRFADAFGLDALGPDGKPIRITMGSYGIGVSRVVAAIAEQHHDERAWSGRRRWRRRTCTSWRRARPSRSPPRSSSARNLSRPGSRCIVDDRAGVSVGVRFTDAELIGAPMTSWSVADWQRASWKCAGAPAEHPRMWPWRRFRPFW